MALPGYRASAQGTLVETAIDAGNTHALTEAMRTNRAAWREDVERMMDAILDRVTAALADGDRVELRGFGTFSIRETKAPTSRNPRSGASVQVPEKTNVHFEPFKTMRARLNRGKITPEDEADVLRTIENPIVTRRKAGD